MSAYDLTAEDRAIESRAFRHGRFLELNYMRVEDTIAFASMSCWLDGKPKWDDLGHQIRQAWLSQRGMGYDA